MAIECRLCSSTDIFCYPADAPEQAICEPCCEFHVHPDDEVGHQFEYIDREWFCRYCGCSPSGEWLNDYYASYD